MTQFLKNKLRNHLINILGWRTNRKIIVIESDDWGTIRMTSKKAYECYLKKGFKVDECIYNKNDALESNDDLEGLFEVLSNIKDVNGNPAIFTINNIIANPDFIKIRNNGFCKYYYEIFTETLKRYPNHDRVLSLYHEGIDKKVILPQFHGREHVNVNRWLADLRKNEQDVHLAFKYNMFTVHKAGRSIGRKEYLDAFGFSLPSERVETIENIVIDGLKQFKQLWGFTSESFIAPCYTWNSALESDLMNMGVKYIQGNYVQISPTLTKKGFNKKYHYQGQRNGINQRYLIRNVHFEPSENYDFDWINHALNQIRIAFSWNKPAIICSHRVNYIGSIHSQNRSKNLQSLELLLKRVMKYWPTAEFMTSDQLGDTINSSIN